MSVTGLRLLTPEHALLERSTGENDDGDYEESSHALLLYRSLRQNRAEMLMRRQLIIFAGVLLVLVVQGQSRAFMIKTFLKFTDTSGDSGHKESQIPPSPSPAPSIGLNSGGNDKGNGGVERFGATPTDKRCDQMLSPSKGCRVLKNVTACWQNDRRSGPQESFIIVWNDEDNSLNVSFTFLPSNVTLEPIEIAKHEGRQVNISEIIGGNDSVMLKAENGSCKIDFGISPARDSQFRPGNATPLHGAYLFVLITLTLVGAWACFKLKKGGRHVDGVRYQELEMGQHPEFPPAANVHTAEGWEQDWSDDWDEEKAVSSPVQKRLSNGRANSRASRSSGRDE